MRMLKGGGGYMTVNLVYREIKKRKKKKKRKRERGRGR
jgi:hypothetical protein